jgi:hypothetical protein
MEDIFQTLVTEASIAVAVLGNAGVTEIEMLPLRPNHLGAERVNELARLWAFRGLRWIGTIGIVDGHTRVALTEPLDPLRMSALSAAFDAHCEVMFGSGIEQKREQTGDELAWLERLHSLEDYRPEA